MRICTELTSVQAFNFGKHVFIQLKMTRLTHIIMSHMEHYICKNNQLGEKLADYTLRSAID